MSAYDIRDTTAHKTGIASEFERIDRRENKVERTQRLRPLRIP